MNAFWMTVYVLIWPLITLSTLTVIVRAFIKEWREARKEGRSIV
ncbi:putative transporter small subunit [Gordonia sp. HY002]|nr:putative transporter small subunit [Gordonia zhenghanii]MCF8570501.1 putative transporter small subunit [Gordonia zhenghanii]MCF8602542.1 putative transporter small subunit [Gordonia zhenghanii]MCF8603830.1 putative transporter small subunit [Gordonia zhenghanii]